MKITKRSAALCLVFAILFTVLSSPAVLGDDTLPSLKDTYADYFLIGTIYASSWAGGLPTGNTLSFYQKHFNAVTAENAMKPDAMQSSKGNFNFSYADTALNHFGSEMQTVGHTLVWHSQSPAFLNTNVSRDEAAENMADHINAVAGHFAGKLLSWDVVNEAMTNGGSSSSDWKDSLRKANGTGGDSASPWYAAFAQDGGDGSEYIYEAFKLTREADPEAKLYYNDFNLDSPAKAKAVYNMVKELNERYAAEGNTRPLIEGIGMQSHYSTNTNISNVRSSLILFASLGNVELSITELDVTIPNVSGSGPSQTQLEKQAEVYAKLFMLYKEYADLIERVTLWGVTDDRSWRSSSYPLLFDKNYNPKPAFYAVTDPEGYLGLSTPTPSPDPVIPDPAPVIPDPAPVVPDPDPTPEPTPKPDAKPIEKPSPAPEIPLPADSSDWALEDLRRAAGYGLIPEAFGDSSKALTTREEFCVLTLSMLEKFSNGESVLEGSGLAPVPFDDTKDTPYGDAVSQIAALGIVNGIGGNLFDPAGSITREQAAKLLALTMQVLQLDVSEEAVAWTDKSDIMEYALPHTYTVYHGGIMDGVSKTAPTFDPKGLFTHEQAVITVLRLYEYAAENGGKLW